MGPQWDHADDDVRTALGACEAEPPATAALCWPDVTFDRDAVVALYLPAYCWTPRGELWEFEDGAFWVTAGRDWGPRRVYERSLEPRDGWSHPAACDCSACRFTRR